MTRYEKQTARKTNTHLLMTTTMKMQATADKAVIVTEDKQLTVYEATTGAEEQW